MSSSSFVEDRLFEVNSVSRRAASPVHAQLVAARDIGQRYGGGILLYVV